jgi:hypothetical protein
MDGPVEIELPEEIGQSKLQAQQLNDAAMAIIEHRPEGILSALSMLRRALALSPHQAETWSNIGLVMWRLGRIDEAGAALRRAVDLHPERADFHGNLGVYSGAIGQAETAERHLQEASQINPDNLAPAWDLSLLYLRNGDWERGLRCYDIRREHRGPKLYPEMPAPLWHGEDLDGKTLYVQSEQGIGDRLLFSRYLAWIKQRWPTCTLITSLSDSLHNLFWEFRHLLTLLPNGVPWPEHIDYAVWLCSLPEVHGTTVDNVPPDPGLLRKRILIGRKDTRVNLPQPVLPSLKIGITWTGNPEQARNSDRSIPLEMLLPLTEDTRLSFYSFQCSPGNKDLERLCTSDLICDLSPGIEKEGWVGTGMALMEMDLLITVCTSVAHLAGAIGIPTWTMLCADPYWIWTRSETTTPWYPDSMRLFRQRTLGVWQPVIDDVRAELSKLADAKFQ